MLNQVEPGAEPRRTPPSGVRRGPSLGRVFFWSWALGIPLVAVGAGVAMLIASNQLDAAVKTYRSAGLCPTQSTSAGCYQLVPGTLVSFKISRGKTGDTADMTLRLSDGSRSTWAKTSWTQEDALRVGEPVRVEIYQGAITTIYAGTVGIQTKDSPVYRQADLRLGAVVIPLIGLVITAVILLPLRRRKGSNPLAALAMIDTTLPIAEQEVLLRHALAMDQADATSPLTPSRPIAVTLPMTLRPRPVPAGYPWWLGLIVAGLTVPMLVLQMRTPGWIALLVLGATAIAMLAAIVLHWLYRHRRMLVVDHLSVRLVNLFGISRVIPRAEIAGLAFPIIMSGNSRVPEEPRLLILDATGRALLRLTRYYSTDDDAAQLAAALGVSMPANARRLVRSGRLRRTIPGAVTWPEAHPYLTSLMLLAPILLAIGLFVWMLNGFK
jgi:hypothetical protein